IARAEKFVRERFVHEGEDAAVALAPGSARRRALELALAELDADPRARGPSTAWRREFSLLLGLERLLSEDEPKLADGTVLSAHQVDALSGTLTALLAAAQSAAPNGNGRAAASASPELLATASSKSSSPSSRRSRASGSRRSRAIGSRRAKAMKSPWPSSPRTPTRPSASGSSTRPARARRWRRLDSSRPLRRAAC